MNPERLMIEILIAAHSVSPYQAFSITQDTFHRRVSMDKIVAIDPETRIPITLADTLVDRSASTEEVAMEKLREEEIRNLLNTSNLTDLEREVFDLRFFGLKPIEIKRALNFPNRQQVTNILNRVKQKILANPNLGKVLGSEAS